MLNMINLTPEMILKKEFKIATKGYDLREVDQFLDEIISDYTNYIKIIKDLEKEKDEQLEQILNLKKEIRDLKTSVEISKQSQSAVSEGTNLDVLKRLSQLENIVYGKDKKEENN